MVYSDIDGFEQWLIDHGALMQQTKSEWEVIRYRWVRKAPYIIYRNKADRLTISPEIKKQFKQYKLERN